MKKYCTVIQNETLVFGDIEAGARPPSSGPLFILQKGDRVSVLWRSDEKDQLAYEIETSEGRKGFIFHEPGFGQFSIAVECHELTDPERVKRYLPD